MCRSTVKGDVNRHRYTDLRRVLTPLLPYTPRRSGPGGLVDGGWGSRKVSEKGEDGRPTSSPQRTSGVPGLRDARISTGPNLIYYLTY